MVIYISRYICDYCGNPISRYGTKSKKAKYHFCDNKCRIAYQTENYESYNGKVYKKEHKYRCIYCGEIHYGKTMARKMCDNCLEVKRRHYMEKDTGITIKELCKRLVKNNSKISDKANKILNYLNKQAIR